MTAVAPLVFPGGHALAIWWRQLASHRPQLLWAGYLLLHRVEALVAVRRPALLDPFDRLVLQALTLPHSRSASNGVLLADAEGVLHLGRQTLRQVLRRLQAEGLAQEEPGQGRWSPTAAGKQVLAGEASWRGAEERRVFSFVETGLPDRPPQFLNLKDIPLLPCPDRQGQGFNLDWLRSVLARSLEWKQAHGFPEDVQQVLTPEEAEEGPSAWQRVILDRPGRLAVALIRAGDEADRLLGFAVRTDIWTLQATEPAFTVGADWPEVFPALTEKVSPEAWRPAWREWCRSQNLTPSEASACSLEQAGHLLRVTAPSRLVARLRSMRNEVLRGETWLLAEGGLLRSAAQVEIVDAGTAAR